MQLPKYCFCGEELPCSEHGYPVWVETEIAYNLADELYKAGYNARNKEQGYDPRGCKEWQDVVDMLTKG